jgi:tetratricopeptide (TPR) repeat protein
MSRTSLILLALVTLAHAAAPPVQGPVCLTAEQLKHVQKLEEQASRAFAVERFEDAARLSGEIARYREKHQGARNREVIDARLSAEQFERLVRVPAANRALVVRALVLNQEGVNLNARVRYREAEAKMRKALDIIRKVVEEHHPETATSYSNLALCLNAQGRHGEALPLHQHAGAVPVLVWHS